MPLKFGAPSTSSPPQRITKSMSQPYRPPYLVPVKNGERAAQYQSLACIPSNDVQPSVCQERVTALSSTLGRRLLDGRPPSLALTTALFLRQQCQHPTGSSSRQAWGKGLRHSSHPERGPSTLGCRQFNTVVHLKIARSLVCALSPGIDRLGLASANYEERLVLVPMAADYPVVASFFVNNANTRPSLAAAKHGESALGYRIQFNTVVHLKIARSLVCALSPGIDRPGLASANYEERLVLVPMAADYPVVASFFVNDANTRPSLAAAKHGESALGYRIQFNTVVHLKIARSLVCALSPRIDRPGLASANNEERLVLVPVAAD
ncbi:hypothetical protein B0H11DRAFT_2412748 [Mycena galericulata]|nr:hypothetical protein B0H11DRAFT_2412748 [Mycena galericulata]